jgi:uncharacterized membrane protein
MGHGHSHRAGGADGPEVVVARGPRVALLGLLGVVLAGTVAGLVVLWPDSDRVEELRGEVDFAAEGVTFPQAEVLEVAPPCPTLEEPTEGCGVIRVRVAQGEDIGMETEVQVPPEVNEAGLRPGDRLELLRSPPPEAGAEAGYGYFGIVRDRPLAILVGLFVLAVLAVARWRGLFALVGLGFAAVVVWQFLIPGLLTGQAPVPSAVVAAVAIMYVVLYTTHGFTMRTSAALGGTLGGVALSAALGAWAVGATNLTGVADEGARVLQGVGGGLDFQQVLVAAIVIAGLGVLNDVTITQASAVWELRAAAPELTRARIFASGMRIGRDHVASTIYTIVFAYTGTALLLLAVVSLYDRPLLDLVGTEEIATEIVRSLAASIGLILAMPLTTAIAALTVPGPEPGVRFLDM